VYQAKKAGNELGGQISWIPHPLIGVGDTQGGMTMVNKLRGKQGGRFD